MAKKTIKVNEGDIVKVNWEDAWGHGAWMSKDDPCDTAKIVSVGIVHALKNNQLILSQGLNESRTQLVGVGAIPVNMITQITKIGKMK